MERGMYELYLPEPVRVIAKREHRAAVQWTDERLAYLRENFGTGFNKDLAAALGCGWRTVVRKARELGLEKEEGFLDKKQAEIVKRMLKVRGPNPMKGVKGWCVPGGEGYRFKRGHVPAMKNNPDLVKRVHDTRNETIRRERVRKAIGLRPLTNMRIR